MNKSLLIVFLTFNFVTIFGQSPQKERLSHDVYDTWNTLENPIVSNNGAWVAYQITPFNGDGFLVLNNLTTGHNDTVQRAYDAAFSPSSEFIVFKIKAYDADLRQARIEKKKKDDMPTDSIGILNLQSNQILKFANLNDLKVPEDESSWLAFTLQSAKNDTVKAEDNQVIKKNKNKLKTFILHISNPTESDDYTFPDVNDYVISENGQWIVFATNSLDSVNETEVKIFNTRNARVKTIFKAQGLVKKLTSDKSATQLAFIYSADTAKVKNFSIYYFSTDSREPVMVIDSSHQLLTGNYRVSEDGNMFFSDDGRKLFWRYAPLTLLEKEDSLPDEDKVVLDLWSWTDDLLQSQQLAELEKELKKNFLAVYIPSDQTAAILSSEDMPELRMLEKNNDSIGLGISDVPYRLESSWEPTLKDYYMVNINNGNRVKILEQQQHTVVLSPATKFLLYFNSNDSAWYAYNILNKSVICLTKKIASPFYDTDFDQPDNPPPYGIAGWMENDTYVLIYDKLNIWKIDPEGNQPAENLTKDIIRGNFEHRYIKLDKEETFFSPDAQLLIKYVNKDNFDEGFYTLNLSQKTTQLHIKGAFRYLSVLKSKDSPVLLFRRSSFQEYPDLWVSNTSFESAAKISNANPQQANYLWGSAELISWIFNEKTYKGLLFKPENFDPDRQYPMITYFYERTSQTLHAHYTPNPSRSVINFPLYTSNDYLIFVPDIEYEIGHPGESALNITLSGVYHLLSQGFVDQNHLGIQGQSWGGYQTAYIVSRTNLFKAAMAGAPVTNMTSAYGAIRRKTGINRIYQYEIGQSRIGANLWERRDLYIENSPLFYADKVETPLLIMSNDNDGAVPWEQGVEMFLALRRLQKPVWLLNYNKDEHNLEKKANRRDLSIRMLQFFDHYLKDAPMPSWMKYGIRAVEKGRNDGYELITD
ncbi:MAG: prolyl oligopeptidase family serine peptidase [Bacteroidales bacterium]|nr:prolyl oligopeptidase family serine peptidase [Bacteroidales bacterium]